MILFPNYSSPQLANFQDRILQQGFHKWLRHKRHLQYEEDIQQSEEIFLKRESRQMCKMSSVHNVPDSLSSLFQCDLPWGAEHDRAEWRRLARPSLKRNAMSLACKAAEQESWESQQEKIWKCNFILYYNLTWKFKNQSRKDITSERIVIIWGEERRL